MTNEELRQLIAAGEDDKIARKLLVDLSSKASKAEFIRDMISLANSHGSRDAYLIMGVANDGTVQGIGGTRTDDAVFQQVLNPYVEAPILFSYSEHELDSKTIGLIRLPASSDRFHVVLKDMNENGNRHLTKGETWIKNGSAKQRPTAWDFKLLREAAAVAQYLQPDLRVTFGDGSKEFHIEPKWVEWNPFPPPARGSLDFVDHFLDNTDTYPPGTECVSFCVWNSGNTQADNVRVYTSLPDGCTGLETIYPRDYLMSRFSASVSQSVEADSIEIWRLMLVHDLTYCTDECFIRFPHQGTFCLIWSAHAGNMREKRAGVLKVVVG